MNRCLLFLTLLFFSNFFELTAEENSHVTLLIKIPTRGRFEKFFYALDQYYEKLSNNISYHFVISCDDDDPEMFTEEVMLKFDTYPNLSYYFGKSASKVAACNRDINKHLNFDIMILGSDDMIPLVNNYDEIILEKMKEHFPDYDGVLHFNDGARGEDLNTLPILGKKYYDLFGYVYYPKYVSFWCDNEFMAASKILNKVVYFEAVLIEHRHPGCDKAIIDELYLRNNQSWNKDHRQFLIRQNHNFGLKKLKLL